MDNTELTVIAEALDGLCDEMPVAERAAPELALRAGDARVSAVNLVHYLAFRSRDVRELQQTLLRHGPRGPAA